MSLRLRVECQEEAGCLQEASGLEDAHPRTTFVQESAKLERREKKGEIRKVDAEADIAEAKADLAKIQATAEAERIRAEAVKLQAEAQKTLAEAWQIDIQSAMSIVESYGKHLPSEQKLAFVAQLILPINTLMLSPLDPRRLQSTN